MTTFCSFLVFKPEQTALVKSLCEEAGWTVGFVTDPSGRFRFDTNSVSTRMLPPALDPCGPLQGGETYGELLTIEGEEAEANNIIQLIQAANVIVEGFPSEKFGSAPAMALPDEPSSRVSIVENVFRTTGFFECFSFDVERPVAVAMATKAWGNTRTIYATEAITPWSTHPRHQQVFEKSSSKFADHVQTSIAINLAFSAIEELKLQVNSSSKKPRWLSNTEHTWNPVVLENLVARLKEAGIDPERKINWVVRGSEPGLQIEPKRELASYADAEGKIRDTQFSVPDAIHACSYLRNYMTAHAFGSESPLVGPYEVFNVQHVVRFLILSLLSLSGVSAADLEERCACETERR
mgnify:CR=1 FL=1